MASIPLLPAKKIFDQSWSYTLYQAGSDWYLVVLCGSIGLYEVTIQLTADELAQYQAHGVPYLEELAAEVRDYYPQRYGDRALHTIQLQAIE